MTDHLAQSLAFFIRERLFEEISKEYRQFDGWARESDVRAAIDRALREAAPPSATTREAAENIVQAWLCQKGQLNMEPCAVILEAHTLKEVALAVGLAAQPIREEYNNVILGMSWIPLNIRHDVIRNLGIYAPVPADILAALAAHDREIRLDEAKWWEHLVGAQHELEGREDCEPDCVYCARIRALQPGGRRGDR